MQGLGVPPDRVCALTAERAPECGVEMTENGPHPPCEETVRPALGGGHSSSKPSG